MGSMRFAFRTDASTIIGTGHVMRCLTLAEALRGAGHVCRFFCRDLPGNLADRIVNRGFDCTLLRAPEGDAPGGPPAHAAWAGVIWRQDAEETRTAIGPMSPDWLVLDHYAFDARWERAVVPKGTKLLVIDDLADRPHVAELLLDQNLGRDAADYNGLVPPHCTRLIGPRYALLRPEFAEKRAEALVARIERAGRGIRKLLISMGGVDLPDATSSILVALPGCPLPADTRITVVMGSGAPALERVRSLAAAMPWPTEVLVDVRDMATLMAEADLAIGATGSTSWERCCLGLPTLAVAIANNQKQGALALTRAGASHYLDNPNSLAFVETLHKSILALCDETALACMARSSSAMSDGKGALRLMRVLSPPILVWRYATRSDAEDVFNWRYHGEEPKYYKNPKLPSFSNHVHWFENALVCRKKKILIIEENGISAAHIRFDQENGDPHEAEISIYLDEKKKGIGMGSEVIALACEIAQLFEYRRLKAVVHSENLASKRAFERAGFILEKKTGLFDSLFLYLKKSMN